jgi:hypothetical protein
MPSFKKNAQDGICEASESEESKYSESNQHTNVTFVSDRLLAISVGYDVSCAGQAHPSGGNSAQIFDRELGQAIDISTGLAINENTSTTASAQFNKIVLNEMAKQAAKERAARQDHECDEEYQRSNMHFFYDGIALSSKAISVDLSTAHVDQACSFTTVIPLEKFAAAAKKGSLLEELVKGAIRK